MRDRSDRGRRVARLTVMATLGCVLLTVVGTASAFNGEPNGWGKFRWGSDVTAVVKGTPEFRKKYNITKLRRAMETDDVILANETEFLGKRFGTQWFFSGKGFNRLVLSWEDSRPSAYNAYKVVLGQLETEWGVHDSEGSDGEWIWEGSVTRASAKRLLVASGSGIEITLVAKEFGASGPAPGTKSKAKGGGKGIVDDANRSFLDDL